MVLSCAGCCATACVGVPDSKFRSGDASSAQECKCKVCVLVWLCLCVCVNVCAVSMVAAPMLCPDQHMTPCFHTNRQTGTGASTRRPPPHPPARPAEPPHIHTHVLLLLQAGYGSTTGEGVCRLCPVGTFAIGGSMEDCR